MLNLNREQQLEQLDQDLNNLKVIDTEAYMKAVDNEYALLKKSPTNTSIFGALAGMIVFMILVFSTPLHGIILLPIFLILVIGLAVLSKMAISGNVQKHRLLLNQAREDREQQEKMLSLSLQTQTSSILANLQIFEQHLKAIVNQDDFECFLQDMQESRDILNNPDLNNQHEDRVDAYIELIDMAEYYLEDAREDEENEDEAEEDDNSLSPVTITDTVNNIAPLTSVSSSYQATQNNTIMDAKIDSDNLNHDTKNKPVKDIMQVNPNLFDVKK
jgi:hypothetical protein